MMGCGLGGRVFISGSTGDETGGDDGGGPCRDDPVSFDSFSCRCATMTPCPCFLRTHWAAG